MIYTRYLSFYHAYDLNSLFEPLPYFVMYTHHSSYHHIYDLNSSFEFLPRLWFELIIWVFLTFVI